MRPETYPAHTLAPDPLQPELALRPPDRPPVCLPIRASPAYTSCCPKCTMVHLTRADYRRCLAETDQH